MTDDPITPERIDSALEWLDQFDYFEIDARHGDAKTVEAALAFTKKYKPVVDGMLQRQIADIGAEMGRNQ